MRRCVWSSPPPAKGVRPHWKGHLAGGSAAWKVAAWVGLALTIAGSSACAPRAHASYGGWRVNTDEDVGEKRREWLEGLRRDCVDKNFADACFKTGQNVEDGVVAPPNIDDAHWFYGRACALEPYEQYCAARDRTAP